MARSVVSLLTVAAVLTGGSGCGASMTAVYEGDLRFEHCMTLDAETHVKPSIRRACWAEWVAFYTYGQTRDRVVHAQLRIRQLNSVSDSMAPPEHRPYARSNGPRSAEPAGSAVLNAAGRCSAECDRESALCSHQCDGAPCEQRCTASRRVCLRQCL